MNETTTRQGTARSTDPPATTDLAKDRAQDVASSAADQARDVTETAKQQAQTVAGEAKGQAQHLVQRTKEELRSQADERASQFSGTLRDVGNQLRALSEGHAQEGVVADVSRDVAHRAHDLADRIDQGGIDRILDDVRSAARRRPGMFLFGAAAAGFLTARIFRDVQEVSQEGAQRSTGPLTDRRSGAYRPLAPAFGTADPTGPAVMPLAADLPPASVGETVGTGGALGSPARPDGAS
jgi:hypothetical protein